MERLSFLAASSAFCLFLAVAFTSAMTTDCLCDGLPGNQCDYCHQEEVVPTATNASAGLQGQYYDAWEQEHDDFHHEWVEVHRQLHKETTLTDEDHREFHQRMEDAHTQFHGLLSSETTQAN